MAILRLGAIITQISGKVGGQTIVNGSQGTYLKNIGNQTKSPSPAQQLQRSATGTLMQVWRTLSEEEYKTWFAQVGYWSFKNRVGLVHFYTGFQIFMLQNQGRLLINKPLIRVAESPHTVHSANVIFTPTAHATLTINFVAKNPNQSYVLWMSNSLGRGQANAENLLKKVRVFDYDAGQLSYDIADDYKLVFGNLQANQRIAYSVQSVITNSGQREKRPINRFLHTT